MEDLHCFETSGIIIHRVVNTICTSNSYVIEKVGTKDIWLIDIGDVGDILKYWESKEIKGVFITHTHFDHIYGLNKLVDIYPKCVIVVSEKGYLGLYNDKLNLSKYYNDSFKLSKGDVVVMRDKDSMELFHNVELIAIETPGHDWSCLTYLVENNLITGDSYIPGLKVVTSFPKSDSRKAECSKRKIIGLAKNKNLYPGHGQYYINFEL